MNTKWLFIIALALTSVVVTAETIEPNQYAVWGISQEDVSIPEGSVITEAVLTIQNIAESNEPLYVHLLDNANRGLNIETDNSVGNVFDGYGAPLSGTYENGNFVCRFSQISDPQSRIWQVFAQPCSMLLADGSRVEFGSNLLELMDYVGNGRGVGIGIDAAAGASVAFDSLNLELTVCSYQDQTEPQTLNLSYPNITPIGNNVPALQFDGVDDIVTIANNSSFHTSSGTVSVWMKTANAGTGWRTIVRKTGDWLIGTYNNRLAIYDFKSGANRSIVTAIGIADGDWHHVALSFQSGVSANLYVDGVLVKTDKITFANALSNTSPIEIGNMTNLSQDFAGMISDVRVHNLALDADAINAIRMGQDVDVNPVGYWRLNQTEGLVALDNSGNGFNGVISGAAWVKTSIPPTECGLIFDGVDDIVTIANSSSFHTPSGTVSVWMKTPNAGTGWRTIVRKTGNWLIGTYNNKLAIYDFKSGANRSIVTAIGITDGNWHHIVLSFESGISAKLYVDGVLVKTDKITFANALSSTSPIEVGNMTNLSQDFAGMITDVRLYSLVLDADAVNAIRAGQDIDANPVGCWVFNEGAGAEVYDSSSNMYKGIISGAIRTAINDTDQKALLFDGLDDIVTVANNASFHTSSGTVSVWMKTSNAGTGWRTIVRKTGDWLIGTYNNKLAIYDFKSGANRSIVTAIGITDGKWHHIALSFQSGVNAKLYVDGVLVKTDIITFASALSNSSPIEIGNMTNLSQDFAGMISDVRLYNLVFDADSINDIRTNQDMGVDPVGCWKLDEGSGIAAFDNSGNGYHGIISKAIWISGQETAK